MADEVTKVGDTTSEALLEKERGISAESQAWWENYWKTQETANEERKKEEERRLERQRLGKNLAELGSLISEAIRASGGAPVMPRDIQRGYDELDKRHQQVYDTYFARQEMLRQQQAARQAQEFKDRLDAVRLDRQYQHALDVEAAKEQTWLSRINREAEVKAEQQAKADALKKEIEEIRQQGLNQRAADKNSSEEKIAQTRADATVQSAQTRAQTTQPSGKKSGGGKKPKSDGQTKEEPKKKTNEELFK